MLEAPVADHSPVVLLPGEPDRQLAPETANQFVEHPSASVASGTVAELERLYTLFRGYVRNQVDWREVGPALDRAAAFLQAVHAPPA